MRIGTRGSALALAQAQWVAERVALPAGVSAEIVEIRTLGDRGEALSDKSRWVSALEAALLDGSIDVAVHSAKDVPADLAEGTELAAVPLREDPRDALVGVGSLAEVPVGGSVGTASLRRGAQLRALRADLNVVELRGNVDTRLRKLDGGEVDALVLAAAGLIRLGLDDRIGCFLDELVPAAGQGALALQTLSGGAMVDNLGHAVSTATVMAERAFTAALGASCQTAVGVRGRVVERQVELTGWVGLPDGSEWISDQLVGAHGLVGGELAARMIAVGARDLLDRAEAMA
jgi:hydroxymethylbilane synthase